MPRYRGTSMPKPKKRKIEQPSESVEEPPAPPAAAEPDPPSTPERQQVKRARSPQSPGMKAVKSAAYEARKANVAFKQAVMMALKAKRAYEKKKGEIAARMDGIGRDWKKKGHPGISSHLERMWKAELELEKEHVACLGASVIMLDLMIDAKDAEIAAQEARVCRLKRLLRVRKHRKWR